MNLPTMILVIVVVAAVANFLVLLAMVARARIQRTQRLADIEGFMSSSYDDDGSGVASDGGEQWMAASEGWPTSREAWSDVTDWPPPGWPASAAVRSLQGDPAKAVETPVDSFEYPAPTSLEQRGAMVESADGTADAEAEAGADAGVEPDGFESVEDEALEAGTADAAVDGATDDPDEGARLMRTEEASDGSANESAEMDTAGPEQPASTPAGGVMETAVGGSLAVPRGRDPLTGLLDALSFEEVLAHEDAREQRYHRAATVIVFELDGLTKLVDRLGAQPGDRIETALGDTIQRLARSADRVARIDRGRYAVLLPETDEVAAINYVERIRRACDLWLESGAIAMRLAIGWASTSGDAGLSGAVRLATERMRLELRRNARTAGDGAVDPAELNGHERAESVAAS